MLTPLHAHSRTAGRLLPLTIAAIDDVSSLNAPAVLLAILVLEQSHQLTLDGLADVNGGLCAHLKSANVPAARVSMVGSQRRNPTCAS